MYAVAGARSPRPLLTLPPTIARPSQVAALERCQSIVAQLLERCAPTRSGSLVSRSKLLPILPRRVQDDAVAVDEVPADLSRADLSRCEPAATLGIEPRRLPIARRPGRRDAPGSRLRCPSSNALLAVVQRGQREQLARPCRQVARSPSRSSRLKNGDRMTTSFGDGRHLVAVVV